MVTLTESWVLLVSGVAVVILIQLQKEEKEGVHEILTQISQGQLGNYRLKTQSRLSTAPWPGVFVIS